MIGDEGGYLTSSGGLVEERLEAAPRTEKRRARSDSLALAIRPEPVRRMTRRAGISSYATSAPANEDIVIKTLRQIADVVLFNLMKEISRLCVYLRRRTVTEEILREALKSFGVTLLGSCDDLHPACQTLKQRNKTSPRPQTGAKAEQDHEAENAACVYFAYAPFVKLLRLYALEQASDGEPQKMTRGVVSCVQIMVESVLIEVLQKAQHMISETTKKKSDASAPTRKSVFSRDLKTVVNVISARHPLLQGRLRPLDAPIESHGSPRGRRSRSGSRHAAQPKVRPKAKASARAKRGSR